MEKELVQAGVVVPGVGIPCVRESLPQSPIQAGDAISVPGKLSFGGLTPKTGSHFEKRVAGVGPSVCLSVCPHTIQHPSVLAGPSHIFGGGN